MLEPVLPSFQFEHLTDMHLHTLKNRLHGIVLVLLLAATCSFTPVVAEDASGARSHEEIVAEITRQRSYIRELDERLADAKGLAREAVDSRLVRARLELLHLNQDFVEQIAAEIDDARKTDALRKQAIEVIQAQLDDIEKTRDLLVRRIKLPEEKMPAGETAVAYSHIFQQIEQLIFWWMQEALHLLIFRQPAVAVAGLGQPIDRAIGVVDQLVAFVANSELHV